MSEDRILLADMVFHGRHGTLQARNELGQPFVVSIKCASTATRGEPPPTDGRTVDYGEVPA